MASGEGRLACRNVGGWPEKWTVDEKSRVHGRACGRSARVLGNWRAAEARVARDSDVKDLQAGRKVQSVLSKIIRHAQTEGMKDRAPRQIRIENGEITLPK